MRTKAEISSPLPQLNHLGHFLVVLQYLGEEVGEEACSCFGTHFNCVKCLGSKVNASRLDKEMRSGRKVSALVMCQGKLLGHLKLFFMVPKVEFAKKRI